MQSDKLHEPIKHGTPDFPLAIYLLNRFHPRYTMQAHWHFEYEILIVTEGNFMLTIEDKTYSISKGDICFFKSGLIHMGEPCRNCVYKCFVFNMQLLENNHYSYSEILKRIETGDLEAPLILKYDEYESNEMVMFSTQKLLECSTDNENDKLLIVSLLQILFSSIYEMGLCHTRYENSEKSLRRISQLKKAIDLIQTQYNTTITLTDMAKATGLSEKYFCLFFKKHLKKTPIEYLNAYRIEQASSMMLNTEFSLIDISIATGFSDYCYFSRLFRKIIGTSPSEYRKSHLKQIGGKQ